VLVERNDFAFFAEIDYENFPDFSPIASHWSLIWKKVNLDKDVLKEKESINRKKTLKGTKKVFVQTRDVDRIKGSQRK